MLVKVKEQSVEQARTRVKPPRRPGVHPGQSPISRNRGKRYRHLGDQSSPGSPILSMYNPELLYMEANLEEDRLPGVEPGNSVHIELDAFPEPFEGG